MTTYPDNIEIARKLLEQQKTINALLAVLTEPLADSPSDSFADDLEIFARLADSFGWHPTGEALRAKAQAIRAAVAAAKGGE